MKKEKFDFGIFILNCFMCIGLIVVSVIFVIPLGLVFSVFIDGFHLIEFEGFYDYSTLLTLSHTLMFALYFFLEKTNIIQYRIYKPSFWFVFISINSFWWFVAYWLSHNFKVYS